MSEKTSINERDKEGADCVLSQDEIDHVLEMAYKASGDILLEANYAYVSIGILREQHTVHGRDKRAEEIANGTGRPAAYHTLSHIADVTQETVIEATIRELNSVKQKLDDILSLLSESLEKKNNKPSETQS